LKILFIILSCLLIVTSAFGQDSTKSFAFKNNRPSPRPNLFYQPDLSYRIWQQFNLIREANSGDPLAQHELGIRYLLGEGVEADTVKAAKWIKSAADHGVTAAKYNYAILLINGWGTEWDPFRAFKFFKEAAEEGMSPAQYAVGLLYTDNLIVKRNWGKAYSWISKSAEKGNEDAEETLKEIKAKVPEAKIDTTASNLNRADSSAGSGNASLKSSLGLVYIDFENVLDSIPEVTRKRLLEDLTHSGSNVLSDSVKNSLQDTNFVSISSFISLINGAAEYGSPEALAFLGYLFESGIYYDKDLLKAIEYYIRASRLDSPTASILLYQMEKAGRFFPLIKNTSDSGNKTAMFDWYGLEILGLDHQITLKDALNLLASSAEKDFTPSLLEYGLYFYSSGKEPQNMQKAFTLWQHAKNLGSKEAEIRMNAAIVLDQLSTSNYETKLDQLFSASGKGSVLAQSALAYAYENGIGLERDKAKAVKYYRESAQRGNRFAYDRLKALYDSIRPDGAEFDVE